MIPPRPAEACTDFGADFPHVPRRQRGRQGSGARWSPAFIATVWPLLALLAMVVMARCSQ